MLAHQQTMKKSLVFCLAAVLAAAASVSRAAPAGGSTVAEFSLWSPSVQYAEPTDSVKAFRLALYGENADVTGLDISVVGVTDGDFAGLQWNGVGVIKGNAIGFIGSFYSLVAYVEGSMTGLTASFVNIDRKDLDGVALGLWNQAGGEATGVQFGFVNYAATLNGLQVGLVNVATGGYGLQVGLVNYLSGSEVFDVLPIANFRF